jgi:hypothetical protein
MMIFCSLSLAIDCFSNLLGFSVMSLSFVRASNNGGRLNSRIDFHLVLWLDLGIIVSISSEPWNLEIRQPVVILKIVFCVAGSMLAFWLHKFFVNLFLTADGHSLEILLILRDEICCSPSCSALGRWWVFSPLKRGSPDENAKSS